MDNVLRVAFSHDEDSFFYRYSRGSISRALFYYGLSIRHHVYRNPETTVIKCETPVIFLASWRRKSYEKFFVLTVRGTGTMYIGKESSHSDASLAPSSCVGLQTYIRHRTYRLNLLLSFLFAAIVVSYRKVR